MATKAQGEWAQRERWREESETEIVSNSLEGFAARGARIWGYLIRASQAEEFVFEFVLLYLYIRGDGLVERKKC